MATLLNTFRTHVKNWVHNRLQQQSADSSISNKSKPVPVPATDKTQTAEILLPASNNSASGKADRVLTSVPKKATTVIEIARDTESDLSGLIFTKASQRFVKTAALHEKIIPFLQQKLGYDFRVSDLLALEPAEFAAMKGVGPAKVSTLRQIQREGRLLLSSSTE